MMRKKTKIMPSQPLMSSMAAELPMFDRHRYVPLAIHNIAQVGYWSVVSNFWTCRVISVVKSPLIVIIPHLEAFAAISQVSDHLEMVFNSICRSADDSANSTASSANSSTGMREVSPGTHTPHTPLNISLMKKSNSIGEAGHPFRTPQRLDVSDGSAITSFHTSDGTPSAPGALLLGVSRSAS
ncbi:hypothetical protein AYI70_g6806, partial [Smittium culicis]